MSDAILVKQKYIFASLFLLANKLQVIGDRLLNDFTIKQWLLTLIIAQFGANPPTLNEVTELMGSSHQNVKQMALKLQAKGYLLIEKDGRDSRAIRLKLTAKNTAFWNSRQAKDEQFIAELFANFNQEELNSLDQCLKKLQQKILAKLVRE